jgi:hypothetical protein
MIETTLPFQTQAITLTLLFRSAGAVSDSSSVTCFNCHACRGVLGNRPYGAATDSDIFGARSLMAMAIHPS